MTIPLQTEQSALQMASLCSIFDCFSWGLSPAHCQVSFRRRCFVVRPSREDKSAGGGLQRYLVWSRNAVGIFHAYILQEQSCSCSPSPYPVPLPLSLQSGVGCYASQGPCAPQALLLHGHKEGGEAGKGPGWDLLHFRGREKQAAEWQHPSQHPVPEGFHCSSSLPACSLSTDKLEKCAGFSLLIQNTSWLLLLLLSLPLLQAVDFVSL